MDRLECRLILRTRSLSRAMASASDDEVPHEQCDAKELAGPDQA